MTRGPSLDPADKRLAVEVEDHPLDYGDFEGTIPKGQYGGGTVMLWDRGYWEPEGDAERMLAKGDLKFTLDGEQLHGGWVLVRMRGDKFGGKRTNWLLIKHHDEYAKEAMARRSSKRTIRWPRAAPWRRSPQAKAPSPNLSSGPSAFRADAVWESKSRKHDDAGEEPRPVKKPASPLQRKACQGAAALRRATIVQAGRSAASGQRLGA